MPARAFKLTSGVILAGDVVLTTQFPGSRSKRIIAARCRVFLLEEAIGPPIVPRASMEIPGAFMLGTAAAATGTAAAPFEGDSVGDLGDHLCPMNVREQLGATAMLCAVSINAPAIEGGATSRWIMTGSLYLLYA